MRGNRFFPMLVVAAGLVMSACGGSEVTVQVLGEGADGPVAQANLPVGFFPFNRDSVFVALEQQAESPRPQIPADMLATFQEIGRLQEEWRLKENEWSDTRDRMQTLSEEMNAMDRRARGTREYMAKYEEFEQLEGVERRLDREKQSLFDRFTSLQDSVTSRVDSFKAVRDTWEDEAYAPYQDIQDSLVTAVGRPVFEDTTNADGYVTRSLPSGDWWVVTRIQTPQGEYVWQVKIEPSEVDTLRLDNTNGEAPIRL